jgi:hypothetical protein
MISAVCHLSDHDLFSTSFRNNRALFFCFVARDGAQGLAYARQALYD